MIFNNIIKKIVNLIMTSKISLVNSTKPSKKNKTKFSQAFEIHLSLLSAFVGPQKSNILSQVQKKYKCKIGFELPQKSDPLEGHCRLIIEGRNRQTLKNAMDELKNRYEHVVKTVVNIQKQLGDDSSPQEQ
jgi:hypothetical protein